MALGLAFSDTDFPFMTVSDLKIWVAFLLIAEQIEVWNCDFLATVFQMLSVCAQKYSFLFGAIIYFKYPSVILC